MNKNEQFLSCDWGTTAFRMRLVAAEGFKILAEESSKQGASAVNEEWKNTGKPALERTEFYAAVIADHIKKLEAKMGNKLDGIPVIISGMASSTIGMMELPYKEAPFALDGSDLSTHLIKATDKFPHDILLISGVKTSDDVMRGEETQVVGCRLGAALEEHLVIHPGTHSKHIVVKDGKALSFKTYMTGELFSLMSMKSILAASIETEQHSSDEEGNRNAFAQGVKDGAESSLLHQLFMIRSADLFKHRSRRENYHYLSGLLIGSELASFPKDFSGKIVLAGEAALVKGYKVALDILGLANESRNLIIKDADSITLQGQYEVYHHQQKP